MDLNISTVNVSMLKAREVWDEQESRKQQRMAAMRPVLAQLYGKIRRQAIQAPNAPYVVFEILLATLQTSGFQVWVVDEKYLLVSWIKTPSGRTGTYRPPLITNYRPQVYDPVTLGSMLR
jgi:hypothetical protein